MKLSIALATYNGAKFLKAQLDSFLAQTRLPDELIITDDGSIDDTLDIIKRFAETTPFPVVWSQNEQNLGYGGNFNAALQKTTGDLVFLSDQDDVWFPEKIARMVALAEVEPQALVLMNDAELTDEALRSTGLTKLGQIRSAGFSEDCFVMGCCAAVRRELLDICLPIPAEVRGHDNWIVGIADGLRRKKILPETLQYYRRHGENESQCIINRTTRVTPMHVQIEFWQDRLLRWSKRRVGRIVTPVDTKPLGEFMLEWLNEVVQHAPSGLSAELTRYREDLQRKNQALRIRQDIRSFPLGRRLIAAFLYWRNGGYASFSGVKSAIVDVFAL